MDQLIKLVLEQYDEYQNETSRVEQEGIDNLEEEKQNHKAVMQEQKQKYEAILSERNRKFAAETLVLRTEHERELKNLQDRLDEYTAPSAPSENTVTTPTENTPNNELPAGWEEKRDEHGKIYYENHNNQTTHWDPPGAKMTTQSSLLSNTPPPVYTRAPPRPARRKYTVRVPGL